MFSFLEKYNYPLPRRLARMVISRESVTVPVPLNNMDDGRWTTNAVPWKKDGSKSSEYIHPSLLDNVSIEGFFKLLKFGLWVDYKIRRNTSLTVGDLIRKELEAYPGFRSSSDSTKIQV
jgi:hypothetical protein